MLDGGLPVERLQSVMEASGEGIDVRRLADREPVPSRQVFETDALADLDVAPERVGGREVAEKLLSGPAAGV